MKRLVVATVAVLVAVVGTTTRGDDFGKFLEKAARKTARDLVERSVAPRAEALANPAAAPPEQYPVQTADGWTLVAHRYKPPGRPKPGALPVILCHGLTYNASFWDLDPSCSLPRYLASQGYDVWSVDLRGCGMSQKWVFKLDEAPTMVVGGVLRRISGGRIAPTGYATVDPKAANWDLDAHIAYDVPAFVQLVRHHSKAQQVAWVGHSMGGIVAICHLSRYQNPGIGRLVTVGSQVTMPNGQVALQFFQEMLVTRQGQLVGKVKGEELYAQTRSSVHNLFFNVRNVSPKVYEALGTYATDVPSLSLMKQYSAMAAQGELLDAKKQFNYARALGNVKVPMLISCGAGDQFAPPVVQQYLHDNVGSADKTLLIFGRADGFAADAGHDDALVGLNSRAQVYPVIENWLRGGR